MNPPRPTFPTARIRVLLSGILVWHLVGMIMPPLSFQSRGPLGVSPAVATLLDPVEGYSQALYMDRGYAFFAPDPGPSHLIQAAITAKDGSRVERLYPDLDDQWPRLLYHRHFMLSEFLTEIYHPPGPPLELARIDPSAAEDWVRARARYEHVRQSIVDHLKAKHPGQDVAIRRVEHFIPDLVLFEQSPIMLDAPELYRVLLDTPIDMSAGDPDSPVQDLVAPKSKPEAVPAPAADREPTSDSVEPKSEGNASRTTRTTTLGKEPS